MAGIPEFKSYEDMKKFIDKANAGKATESKPTGKKRSSRKRKPAETDQSKNLIETKPNVPIFKTIHFYLRPGDSWDQVLKDGREETNYAGPGTIVCCHQHLHGEQCKDSCRSMG
jgi:hypothetical protein